MSSGFIVSLPVVEKTLQGMLALPGRPAEFLAARDHAAAGELVHLLPDAGAQVLGQRGGGIFEQQNDVPRCGTIVEETALAVPDQRAFAGVPAIAELEQGDLAVRLPDEQIEVLVVEPAALGGRVVG